ncbi:deoxyribodipyrimidine photo-lyase [Saccharopolyspora sp. HNM0983]|uniref:Deoxyribodipyrimidine photo-lyase n=1 Tax=Saccharopolyspora montiporae TaxID=2781240 RepID=A0A929B7Z2_9PSEU|nr:deoxyribodipyrimidine photo-lyase [Saccharopolyspora sp. HNM0983]MBE9373860.1 deoxyribodipyrimidine photo-lyase [Saccharopolyspora sp. HNM0983]
MRSSAETSVAVFTRDLRVQDNPVLCAAARAERLVALFVLDDAVLGGPLGTSPNRAAFLAESLADLDAALRDRGGHLVVRRGDVVAETRAVAAAAAAHRVHIAADVSGYAQHRTEALDAALRADGRALDVHAASVTAVEPGAVTPAGKDHFAVFTPYHRRWAGVNKRSPLPAPNTLRCADVRGRALPTAGELCSGAPSPARPRGGGRQADRLLGEQVRTAAGYESAADDLAADATSRLSPHLHFGCVSAVSVLHAVGADSPALARQIAWRDFHHQVLAARPSCAQRDYRDRGDRWRTDPAALRAWQQGRTGYPIVDAGMRQLLHEGWMHNRARLITASFLTKTLYLDWRRGAAHFLELLVDGDIANNQLNWQWVAGTGTDTRPNRVLNPLAQAAKYDPRGEYVRRYLPELAGICGSAVHRPWRLPDGQRAELDYPEPIVDLDAGAHRFRTARGA